MTASGDGIVVLDAEPDLFCDHLRDIERACGQPARLRGPRIKPDWPRIRDIIALSRLMPDATSPDELLEALDRGYTLTVVLERAAGVSAAKDLVLVISKLRDVASATVNPPVRP